MNKKSIVILVTIMLASILLAGCIGRGSYTPVASETPTQATIANVSEEPSVVPPSNDSNAEQAYMDFLNNRITVQTADSYGEDDSDYNADGLLFGEYTYSEIKATIAEFEGCTSKTLYTITDLGSDGEKELVLRFESIDPLYMNYNCVVKYDGEYLKINYSYEDGYRSSSNLYDSGYLLTGGSVSAGGITQSVIGFDENGCGYTVFTRNDYFSSFASSIAYDLNTELASQMDDYYELAETSELMVGEYVTSDGVFISPTSYSEDPATRALEDALVQDLVSKGAVIISEEEYNTMTDTSAYATELVEWTEFVEENGSVSIENPLVSIDYYDEASMLSYDSFEEFYANDSEEQVKVQFIADSAVSSFQLLSLELETITDNGDAIYNAEEVYYLKELSPSKPLVASIPFFGDIPNMGIAYLDNEGNTHTYAIGMSGMDGSLLLTDITMNE